MAAIGNGISDCFVKSHNDPDALKFVSVAGITDSIEISALNTFVKDLKAINLILPNFVNFANPANSILRVFYPFIGKTANSCKYNLLDPQDNDAAFRIIWTGAASMTFTNIGIKGLGNNTTYGDTRFNPLNHFTDGNSNGLDIFVNSHLYTNPTRIEIGTKAVTFYSFGNQFNSGSMFCKSYSIGSSTVALFKKNKGSGFIQMNLISNAIGDLTLKINNETYFSNTALVSGSMPNLNIAICKMNGETYYSDNYISCVGIRISGLNDTVNTLYHKAVKSFIIALGRYPSRLLYTDGHSMMLGFAGAYTFLEIFQKSGNTLASRYIDFLDQSASGLCFDDIEGHLNSFYTRSLNYPVSKKIIVSFCGVNDICVDGLTAAQTWSRALSYINNALGYGFIPVLLTVLPTTLYAKAAEIIDYNILLKNNIPAGAYYVDLDLIPETADPDDLLYYSDKLHPTATLTHLITTAVSNYVKLL